MVRLRQWIQSAGQWIRDTPQRSRRAVWSIGGIFCEIGDRELLRRQQDADRALAEDVRLLRQHLEEVTRKMALNEQHRIACDERAHALEQRLQALGTDYLETLRILHGEAEPPVRVVKGA